MIKKIILLIIPFAIAVATMVRCWFEILLANYVPQWQHYSAILCAIGVVFFLFKDLPKALIATGVFFIIGTLNGFSLTSSIEKMSIGIFGLQTPQFNGLSFGLLFLYFVLNFMTMVNLHLDNKERKSALQAKLKVDAKQVDNTPN